MSAVAGAPRTVVRPEVPADFDTVTVVLTQAFGQPDESLLVERLRSEGHYAAELTLVAELHGAVVGHVLFSGVVVEDDGPGGATTPALALAPVAVLPPHQRMGVGYPPPFHAL